MPDRPQQLGQRRVEVDADERQLPLHRGLKTSAGRRGAGAWVGLAEGFSVPGPIEALGQPPAPGGGRLGLELPIYGTIPPWERAAAGAARRRLAPRTQAFVLRRRCNAPAPALGLLAR